MWSGIARSTGIDVVSGEGLDEALAGAETIIDTATGPLADQGAATEPFTASARNLQRAAAAAGAKRIVVVSIIGIDKFAGGYNAAKVAQEHGAALKARSRSGSSARPVSRNCRSARRVDDPGRRRLPARDANAARPPASSPSLSPTRPRSRRSRTAGSPRSRARGRSVSPMRPPRWFAVEVTGRDPRGPRARRPHAAGYVTRPEPAKLAGPSFEELARDGLGDNRGSAFDELVVAADPPVGVDHQRGASGVASASSRCTVPGARARRGDHPAARQLHRERSVRSGDGRCRPPHGGARRAAGERELQLVARGGIRTGLRSRPSPRSEARPDPQRPRADPRRHPPLSRGDLPIVMVTVSGNGAFWTLVEDVAPDLLEPPISMPA